jgi:hypothetical protein
MEQSLPPIEPDTKDWTWILQRPCPECGFDATALDVHRTGELLRAMLPAWSQALAEPDAALRPRPDQWSPLEYACHVRDVCSIFADRLALMLSQDNPEFANWDQDRTAVDDDYGSQTPAVVAAELDQAGRQVAVVFDAVGDDEWDHTARRSDGAEFTVDTFARYFLHDPTHHLWDITGTRAPAS